jgi:O-antigen biosynthesis protein
LPSDGYAGSLSCAHEVSAVTAACLMTPRVLYETIDGFNEHFFTHYQDVDLCLRIRQRGKRIIFSPHARFVHHESHSRGKYYDFVDRNLLLDSWEPLIKNGDPYYNPNFNVDHLDYTLKH